MESRETDSYLEAKLAELRVLETRRLQLCKELATVDARIWTLLGVDVATRKPASHMPSASERARLMLSGSRSGVQSGSRTGSRTGGKRKS